MATIMKPTSVKKIEAYKKVYAVTVRVLRKWIWDNEETEAENRIIYGMELILIDFEGELIQATVTKTLVRIFNPLLHEGRMYIISKFLTEKNLGNDRATFHKYRIAMQFTTKVQEVHGHDIPTQAHSFVSIEDIIYGNVQNEYYIDVMGVITQFHEAEKTKGYEKMFIDIIGHQKRRIRLTVWKPYFLEVGKMQDMFKSLAEKPVVVFKCVQRKEWYGNVTISTTRGATKFEINPDIPEVAAFKNRIRELSNDGLTGPILELSKESKLLAGANIQSLASIKEIKKAGYYVTYVYIEDMNMSVHWYFNSCGKCLGKVTQEADQLWYCKKPGCKVENIGVPRAYERYQLKVEANDGGDLKFQLMLWDGPISKIIGKQASTIIEEQEKEGDKDAVPLEFRDLMEREFIAKIYVDQDFNIQQKSTCYKATQLCGDKDVIKKWKELEECAKALEACLQCNGSTLRRFEDMPFPESSTPHAVNTLVFDELSYDRVALREEHVHLLSSMTDEQKLVYDEIMDAVRNNRGGVFFVHGYGGTGKTFLWRTLCDALRSRGEIVLPVASSGIASTLLPGGMTAHSRLSIPISTVENSTCTRIKPGSDIAELLIRTKLIIWDEAPMTHRYAFEAVDRSLRDVMCFSNDGDVNQSFGGKVVVFGGDFRQILPVTPKGSRSEIVNASLCASNLWSSCKVLRLTKNMRLQGGNSCSDVAELKEFSEWVLKVGDGKAGDPNDGEVELELPNDILIKHNGDPIASIVEAIYPSHENRLWSPEYLQERAILAPIHEIVELVNDYVLSRIDEDEKIYYSFDEVSKDESNIGVRDLYSTEFLNSIKCSGLPNHELKLKVGAIVMLLRNIDQSRGLCNDTRLIVTDLGSRVIRATVVSGSHKGDKVHIACITLSPSDSSKFPVQFDRRQFPVAMCFAMTINKSQGQSLEHVGLYLPRSFFTHGQLYVAISRVTSKKGLKILICDNEKRVSNRTTNVVYKEIFEKL